MVSVVATSSGAAAAYVRDGLSNIRIAMFLELATTVGAICGAFLASKTPTNALAILFGVVLLHSAWQVVQAKKSRSQDVTPQDALSSKLNLGGTYVSPEGAVDYKVSHAKSGFGLMYVAGVLSGMLGIGSGALKVIAMDRIMGIPFKVSTATSSFMIGVTAVASAAIYLKRGYIHPLISLPVMLGVLGGSMVGARLLPHLPVKTLRRIFAIAVAVIAVQMISQGIRGGYEQYSPCTEQASEIISLTLRVGVLLASAIGMVGGAPFMSHHAQEFVSFGRFAGTNSPFASTSTILSSLRSGDDAIRSLSITQIGILVLLLTPITRVAFSIIGFAMERDRLYFAITSIVLLTLLTSVVLH